MATSALLQRASVLALVFVPVFAHLWPSVYATLLLPRLDVVSVVCEQRPSCTQLMEFGPSADASEFESPPLPIVWLFTYIAASFSVFGQLAYLIGAPRLVRQFSFEEYVEFSAKLKETMSDDSRIDRELASLAAFDAERAADLRDTKPQGGQVTESRLSSWNREVLRSVAEGRYISEARKANRVMYWVSLMMYIIALVGCMGILGFQALSVLEAAAVV